MFQTWYRKYAACPLRPSRPWLQEVVPSIHCLQWVFLHPKPKSACEPHCLSLAAMSAVEQPQLICRCDIVIKPDICNTSQHPQRRTEALPYVTCTKNWWRSDVWFRRYDRRDKHTDRHARHNTLLPYPPVGGRVINKCTRVSRPWPSYHSTVCSEYSVINTPFKTM